MSGNPPDAANTYELSPEEEELVRELEEVARHVRLIPPGAAAGQDVLDPVKYGFPLGMDDAGNLFPNRPRSPADPASTPEDDPPVEPT